MANVTQALPVPAKTSSWLRANWGVLAAVAALVVILLLPTPANLPVAGHRMLAILAFAVIIWMTEAIDYAVSAIVIAALMAFLLGLAPSVTNPNVLLGTSAGDEPRFQRLYDDRPCPCRRGAVSRGGHDNHRARPAHRAHHPLPGRHQHAQRHSRHDPGRLRDRVYGAVNHGPRRVPRPDYARHHLRVRRQQAQRLCQHADDHHGADRKHLECRHQDRCRAEHGRHRLHREGLQSDDYLGRMADGCRAVQHPDVDRSVFCDDADDAAGDRRSRPAACKASASRWPSSGR